MARKSRNVCPWQTEAGICHRKPRLWKPGCQSGRIPRVTHPIPDLLGNGETLYRRGPAATRAPSRTWLSTYDMGTAGRNDALMWEAEIENGTFIANLAPAGLDAEDRRKVQPRNVRQPPQLSVTTAPTLRAPLRSTAAFSCGFPRNTAYINRFEVQLYCGNPKVGVIKEQEVVGILGHSVKQASGAS